MNKNLIKTIAIALTLSSCSENLSSQAEKLGEKKCECKNISDEVEKEICEKKYSRMKKILWLEVDVQDMSKEDIKSLKKITKETYNNCKN